MTKLEELKAAYEAATPDEDLRVDLWDGAGATLYFGTPDRDGDLPYEQMLLEQDNDNVFKPADDLMNFIALAHNMMPLLFEAVEALQTIRDRSAVTYNHDYAEMRDADWHTADEALEKLK